MTRDVKVPEGNYLVWGGEFENQKRALARLAVIVPFSFLVVFVLLYMALGSVGSAFSVLAGRAARDERRRPRAGRRRASRCRSAPRSASSRCSARCAWRRCSSSARSSSGAGRARICCRRSSAGAASRFRTVLMTALLAILGLMPAALSSGVGSETQRPFAVVIIGGLVTAVAVTLFVLPFAYSLIVRRPPATATDSESEM